MTPDTPDILPNEAGYTRKKSRFKGMDPKEKNERSTRKGIPSGMLFAVRLTMLSKRNHSRSKPFCHLWNSPAIRSSVASILP